MRDSVVLAIDPHRSLILRSLNLPGTVDLSMKDAGRYLRMRAGAGHVKYRRGDLVRALPRFAALLTLGDRDIAWVTAWLRAVGARVVVTSDNHHRFLGKMVERSKGFRVITIQSGFQTERDLRSLSGSGQPLTYDIFLAWGQSDIDRLDAYGVRYNCAIPIGSVLDSIHRRRHTEDARCDVAVVLMKPRTFAYPDEIPYRSAQKRSRSIVYKYLRQYCESRDLTPVMALRAADADEASRQQGILSDLYQAPFLVSNWQDPFGSYDAVMGAEVSIGDQSSLLVEALGRGRRILSVNMTEDPSLDFPIDGIWRLKKPSFTEFERRLDTIRTMSDTEWKTEVGEVAKKLIASTATAPADVAARHVVETARAGRDLEGSIQGGVLVRG